VRTIILFLIHIFKAMRRRIRGILMSGKQFSLDSRMDLVQGMVPTASKKAIMLECTTNPSEETSGDV